MPEEEAAERLAMRLDNVDIVDSFKVSDRYSIIETRVPSKYIGMTLREADLTNRYKIIVLTTVKSFEQQVKGKLIQRKEASGIAGSETVLEEGDLLVLFGELADIKKLIQKVE